MGSVRFRLFILLMILIAPACLGGGGSNNKPPATLPSAPTSLASPSAASGRIDLTWIDTSNNEFEFRIERSDDGGVTYTQVGTAPKNIQGFTDLGLVAKKDYWYRVAAWNAKGLSPYAGPIMKSTTGLVWAAGSMTGEPGFGRGNHSAIYDSSSTGKRMIVFGGMDDFVAPYNDVWSYSLASATPGNWSPLTTTGTPPLPRFGHSAVYDPLNNRMIVFGGIALVPPPPPPPTLFPTFEHQNDVHVLNLTTLAWSQPAITGTPPTLRAFHSAIYDSMNERMVVYGGNGSGGQELDDVYFLSLGGAAPFSWTSPGLGARPVGREQHASIFDPLQSRMVMFGGLDNETLLDGSVFANDTWTLPLTGSVSWGQLFFAGTPGFRMAHSAVYDATNQRMVIFGGNINSNPTATAEMWGLKLHTTPSWTILNKTSGSLPLPRSGHTAVYDSGFNRMIVYGGFDDFATTYDEVWFIDF